MERSFEDNLRSRGVNKNTIKAFRKECITNITTFLLFSDSDINQLCAKHKISEDMKILLKQIFREEQNSRNGQVASSGTPSPLSTTDLNPPSKYKDPFSPPTPSLSIPPHSSDLDQQMGASIASYEFHPKCNYLSASAGSTISAGQEVTKLFDEHQQLDKMAREGLMSSRDRDLDKARLVVAKSPAIEQLEKSMTRREKSLDDTNDRINRLTESSPLVLGTRVVTRRRWCGCICDCFSHRS
jgi:hypothetical protein